MSGARDSLVDFHTGESAVPDPVVTLDDGTVATLSSTKTPDLFQADLDLEHARRTANEAQRDIASVSTGVIHLAKLLEAYTKKTPKDDPVKRLSFACRVLVFCGSDVASVPSF